MDLGNLGCVFFISSSATLGKILTFCLIHTHVACRHRTLCSSTIQNLHMFTSCVLLLIIAGTNISNKRINLVPIDKKMKLYTSNFLNGEGNGTPLQYSCLENPMDGGAWQAAVHGVAKSQTQLNDFTFTFHFHVLEKEMATHSSVLAWRIPGTAEPGGLPSMGSHRVGHD